MEMLDSQFVIAEAMPVNFLKKAKQAYMYEQAPQDR